MKITDRLIPGDRGRPTGVDTSPARKVEQTPRQDKVFTRAVSEARRRHVDQPALAERLDALAQPAASDARSYDNARSIELLQHVIDSVLPSLEADDDTVSAAREIIGEELDWRQAWETRMNDATVPSADRDLDAEGLS